MIQISEQDKYTIDHMSELYPIKFRYDDEKGIFTASHPKHPFMNASDYSPMGALIAYGIGLSLWATHLLERLDSFTGSF